MAGCQIHHVDIVADTGAVGRIIIVPEDAQKLPLASGRLGHIGQQIVGHAPGILSDQPAGVGANGIEIPQQGHSPTLGSRGCIGQDPLAHCLGLPIGVGRRQELHGLHHGGGVFPVDRRRGAEDETFHPMGQGEPGQDDGAEEVVAVVVQRLGDGFSHGLEACEVDDPVEAVAFEDRLHGVLIGGVGLMELWRPAADLADLIHYLSVAVAEIVHQDYFVSCVEEFHCGVAPDVSGPSGDEYLHFISPLWLSYPYILPHRTVVVTSGSAGSSYPSSCILLFFFLFPTLISSHGGQGP